MQIRDGSVEHRKRIGQCPQGPRPPEQIEHPGFRCAGRSGLLEAEFVGPGHHRPKQQLIIGEDDQKHGQHGVADGEEVLLLDRQRDVGADPGQRHRGISDRDRFRRHHEEPAAGHRHHRVPDQAGHGERHVEPPEALPSAEVKALRRLLEILRDVAHRLVHAERHVPGLAGENREHASEFGAEHAAGKQIHEEDDGEGQKAEDRHRLQDIEQRNQHHLGAPALGGKCGIDEGENDRANDGEQHPHRRSQGVGRQIGRIERYRRDIERRQRSRGLLASVDNQHQCADHKHQGHYVPDVGSQRMP